MQDAHAELAAAGRRQAEIDRRIAEATQKLKDRAEARKGKRGRMSSAEQAKEDSLNALLVRLRRGYLPGEMMSTARAPVEQVIGSARQNLQHHAAGGVAPSGRPGQTESSGHDENGEPNGGGSGPNQRDGSGGSSSGGRRSGGRGDDDDGGSDDDDDIEDAGFRNYYRVTPQQRAFNLEAKEHFKKNAANRTSACFRPKDVLKAGCDRSLIGVGPCHAHAPHLYLGLAKPPCPKHGWPSVDKGCVTTRGWCDARRVYDDGIDEWVIGQRMICSMCKAEYDVAVQELDELDEHWDEEEDLERARAAVKAASYVYRSYNHISMRIYAERYGWCAPPLRLIILPQYPIDFRMPLPLALRYVHSLPYVILNKRTAVTRRVERRLVRAGIKTNPTALAEEFLEDKHEALSSLQAQVYGMHVWAQAKQAGQQLTLEQMMMDEPELVTAESIGLCSPGQALIRHFFLAVQNARAPYQLSWRQQNVPMTIGSVDATFKRGKALDLLKIRQTVFSNDVCAPAISVWVPSASMDDSAFSAACADYNKVLRCTHMLPLKLMYLDCPSRDAGGAGRRFPQLTAGMAAREYHVDVAAASLVTTLTGARRATDRFNDARLLGVDCEWRPRGKVATVQISDGCEDHAIFHLPSLGGVIPPSLIALIKSKRLCGVKVNEDLKKLSEDYPDAALNHHCDDGSSVIPAANIIELSSLGVDVLRCSPRSCASLKAIFELCHPDLLLNKELCGAVWKVDWTKWPLEHVQLQYALNDAGASARCGLRLLHPPPSVQPCVVPPQPQQPSPSPPPMPSADHMATGARVFDSLPDEVRACLSGGNATATPIRAEEDEHADDDEEHGARATAAEEGDDEPPDYRTMKTVLQAARRLIDAWIESGDLEPLKLPAFLSTDDRGVLHDYCEGLGLSHETCGEGGGGAERCLRVSRRGADGGGSGEADTGLGLGRDIMARLRFRDDLWKLLLIKYDARHFFGNWFLMAQSKSSALFKYFCIATSDAAFLVREGQRERVKAHLRKLFKQGDGDEERARVDALILRVKRKYWRSHCEYTIPEPKAVVRSLLSVYLFFKDLDDPETGRPFFSAGHQKRCITELQYVAFGWLSDHPTIPLYRPGRTLKTGFIISRCLRSSSGLEGYHAPFNDAMAACGHRAGLQWMEASSNEFDWRWTVRALRAAGIIPYWVRHFNLALIDEVWDLAETLFEGGGALALPDWRRTQLMKAPLLRHGFDYGLEALRQSDAQSNPSSSHQSEAQWLADRLGSSEPVRTRRTAEDVDALMANGADASADELMQIALDRGLYLSPADAAGFTDAVVADERARALLDERGYRELQQAIRRRAPPKPPAPPLVLGVTCGSMALPGPLGAMPAALRDPAVLSECESEADNGEGDGDNGDDDGDNDGDEDHGDESGGGGDASGGGDDDEAQTCPKCGRIFSNAGGFGTHIKTCNGLSKKEKRKLRARQTRAEAAAKKARETAM